MSFEVFSLLIKTSVLCVLSPCKLLATTGLFIVSIVLPFPEWVIVRTYFFLFPCKEKFAQSCLTLCDPMDYTAHGILQARILEWVALPSPGDLPDPGIKPGSPALQADSLPTELSGKPNKKESHR